MASVQDAQNSQVAEHQEFAYRPALDGLRGLAVAMVVLFHAHERYGVFGWAAGGFIGIDVFFVLSGFLITSLLVTEHRRAGRISLVSFWLRRAARLWPALVAMTVGVALVTRIAGADLQTADVGRDGLATLFYFSNWWFLSEGVSYFDSFGAPSVFRHTWSLAIEEQWYVVWPIVVSLILRSRRAGLRLLFALTLVGAAASMAAMWMLVDVADTSRVYFGTDTRAQSLLIGSALAVWPNVAPARFRLVRGVRSSVRSLAGVAALAVLAWLSVVADDDALWLYRFGLPAAAVATGTIISIARPNRDQSAGPESLVSKPVGPETALNQMLSLRPLRAVGTVSYGLYLWHWPVMVLLTPGRSGQSPMVTALLAVGVSVILTLASYHLLEKPMGRLGLGRTNNSGSSSPASALATSLSSTAGPRSRVRSLRPVNGSVAYLSGGVGMLAVAYLGLTALTSGVADPDPGRRQRAEWNDHSLARPPDILVVGDRHASSLLAGYDAERLVTPLRVDGLELPDDCRLLGGRTVAPLLDALNPEDPTASDGPKSGVPQTVSDVRDRDRRDDLATDIAATPNSDDVCWSEPWSDAVAENDPDVTVMVTTDLLHDRVFADGELSVYSPEYVGWVAERFKLLFGTLNSRGGSLVLLNVPCERTRGFPAGEPMADDQRRDVANRVLNFLALANDDVFVLDVDEYLCGEAGGELGSDYLDAEAAATLWPWLERRLAGLDFVDRDFDGREPGVNDSIRLFLAGDSVAQTLNNHYFTARDDLGLDDLKYTRQVTIGCGAVLAEPAVASYRSGYADDCAGLSGRLLPPVRAFRPDVTAFLFGAWEVIDWRVDGAVVEAGTPEHHELVRRSLIELIEPTLETGSRVLLFEVPCMGEGDTPAPVPDRLDVDRVAAVNRVLVELADADERVEIFETGRILCPDGSYEHERDGVVERYDGVHYGEEGALRMWSEIAAAVEEMFSEPSEN